MKAEKKKWYLETTHIGIIASILLHLAILGIRLGYQSQLNTMSPSDSSNEPIEIAEIPPEVLEQLRKQQQRQKLPRQIVETEKADNNEIDPNTRFLSDRNQKAEKQTRAKAVDDFREKKGTGSKQVARDGNIPPTGEDFQKQQVSDLDVETGVGINETKNNAGIKRDWKTLSLKDLSIRPGDGSPTAASDDRLNGVGSGDRTILSTREFRYFSYYHRIKVLLRQYWKPNVEKKLYRMWERGKKVREQEMTTRLLVLLTEDGKIQKVSRLASSGIRDVDDAAVEAFQQAAPFPNPPKGIIDEDGFVRIRWDFILRAQAGPTIQFSRGGGGRRPTRREPP